MGERRAGYALDKSPADLRANIQKQTAVHTKGQFKATSSPDPKMHVFGGSRTTLCGGDSATPFYEDYMKSGYSYLFQDPVNISM